MVREDLSGRVAIVTGGGGPKEAWSLGKAIAARLADCGASIFIIDSSEQAARVTGAMLDGRRAAWGLYVGDVASELTAKAAVAACVERFGRLDILVNNAGIGSLGGPVDIEEAEWDRVMAVNLKAMYLSCRHALPVMLSQKAGVVVNISSLASLGYTGRPLLAYSVSKAGVNQLTREIALQYARLGIRANTVVVGMIDTPMIRRYIDQSRGDLSVKEVMRMRDELVPMGKQGDARDIANAVVWLASDEARFVTGTELVVDGGASARSA